MLLAGYYFFGSWKPAYLGIIIITTIINFFAAIAINNYRNRKKLFLILAIVFDLGVLFLFKYSGFFTQTISQVFYLGHIPIKIPQFSLLVPIGISFYTFQTIGYMIDVYKNKIKAEKHLGYFALFVCFFPQLSAGPIERAQELMPQLRKRHEFQYPLVVDGIKLFALGLFKKMVIADNLAVVSDTIFNSLPTYKGASLILAVVIFSWQIYMDFSGYTDMARGIAKMLGVNLVENFNRPYLATSVQDFWRRWHMSLSRWFRDYVYIQLGGNRKGHLRTYFNTLIVFVIVGIWHGAAWNFILWGFFHGLIMAVERIVKTYAGQKIRIPFIIKILYAYSMVSISWIFFRANNINDALYILRYSLVGIRNFISPSYLGASLNQVFTANYVEMIIIFSLVSFAIFLEILSRFTSLGQLINKQPSFVRYAIYILLIFFIIQLRSVNIKEFIYIRF
ncbi:MAG: MBOAT family protein [Patescibacteria group bacterium]|nr:MBOAT family protein [Patescibacteria group bacterium]